jgi:ribosome-associated protein
MKKISDLALTPSTPSSASTKQQTLLCAQAALAKNAQNIQILDLSNLGAFTDYLLICSAFSDRQVNAIAESVATFMRTQDARPISQEGLRDGRWALLDFGDLVVHVFNDAVRDYYKLEEFWGHAPQIPIPHDFYVSANQPAFN